MADEKYPMGEDPFIGGGYTINPFYCRKKGDEIICRLTFSSQALWLVLFMFIGIGFLSFWFFPEDVAAATMTKKIGMGACAVIIWGIVLTLIFYSFRWRAIFNLPDHTVDFHKNGKSLLCVSKNEIKSIDQEMVERKGGSKAAPYKAYVINIRLKSGGVITLGESPFEPYIKKAYELIQTEFMRT